MSVLKIFLPHYGLVCFLVAALIMRCRSPTDKALIAGKELKLYGARSLSLSRVPQKIFIILLHLLQILVNIKYSTENVCL